MTELRRETLDGLSTAWKEPSGLGEFSIHNLSFARHYDGYRKVTEHSPSVFRAGQEAMIYGEFEGFRNTEVPGSDTGSPLYRRSFTAYIALRDSSNHVIERTPLLIAGKATETVPRPKDPVHFTGQFKVPAHLKKGAYYLEVFAVDVEAETTTKATISFQIE